MSEQKPGPKLVSPKAPAPVARPAPSVQAPKPGPAGAIDPPVRPPVAPAKIRSRHRFVIWSFLLVVVVPLALVGWYLWTRADDQFASHLGFSVRTEENSSAIELLGGITELSGGSSSDTDILFAYLTSQELVRRVDERVDLRGIWAGQGPHGLMQGDPVFAFDETGTIEDLQEHWERQVSIVYDSGAGLIDLRILAFSPEEARAIATVLLDECTRMINELSDIAREDAIKYARADLEVAVERLKTARQALTEFRNRTQIVDPTIDTQNQMGLLVTLQQQLAEALIELDLMSETSQENNPRVAQAQRRVEVINKRIEAERRNLGIGTSDEQGEVFATLVGEYEGLIVDREFAEAAYTTALAGFDAAQAAARKQSRYLAPHVRPTLAEKAEYPERIKIFLLIEVFLIFGWAIAVLVYYSLRDRK
ncbi:capsule biosynthesis protein [Tropicibacter sp. R15_0]|uniref:capsule biosynthesis protein n=1 Tax=Tropicibacter sp. R15_0 TaxID=2821101 RepID=UPI0025706F03|nr:capsule biosynthesis protein [Tropicibacter sp. R15_0]